MVAATYYWGFLYGSLLAPAGVTGYYIGAALLLLGLILGVAFLFSPSRRAVGLGPDAQTADLERGASWGHGQVKKSQTLGGVGLALVAVGLLWIIYFIRLAYVEGALREAMVGGYAIPTHYVGAALFVVGLLLSFYYVGKVSTARAARNLAVAGWVRAQRATPAAPGKAALPSGITEPEIHMLLKRLDGLMAKLPDEAVTEFSKTPEADTYLKLLGG